MPPTNSTGNPKRFQNAGLIILLVAFLLLHKANSYAVELFNFSLLLYGLFWCALFVVLGMFIRLITRGASSGIVWVLCLCFFLLNFAEIQDFFFYTLNSRILASTWTLAAIFAAGSLIALFTYKTKFLSRLAITNYLLLLFSVLAVYEVGKMIFVKNGRQYDLTRGREFVSSMVPVTSAHKPDIYFLVFDSYTNDTSLARLWNFSNDSINAFLQQKNFKVTHNSKSVYTFTPLSINSTLNLSYLQLQQVGLARDYINFNFGRKAFDSAFLLNWLQQQGYTVNCYSLLSGKLQPNQFYPYMPDEPLHWLRRQTVERIWINPWMFNAFLSKIGLGHKHPQQVEAALNRIDEYNHSLADTVMNHSGDKGKPRFIYAHFLFPHSPYIRRADGSKRTIADMDSVTKATDKQFYLEQLKYTNTVIQQLVTKLLSTGAENKIIIIQGDHGHRNFPKSEREAPRGIFNALYFPQGNYSQVSDTMLSVNTFRVVLNTFFNQQLPMLPRQEIP